MSKNIVIIGGGMSAKHAAEILVKKAKGAKVTIIQANRFVEWPLAMTTCIVKPELHPKALATNADVYQVPGVTYKYGVAESVDVVGKKVALQGGTVTVPYDALVVATGFGVPLVNPEPGVSLDDRIAEVKRVGEAIRGAASVIVAGGGPCGLELAGDIRIQYPTKNVVLLCRKGVLTQWPGNKREKMAAQLKKMNIEVVSNAPDESPTTYTTESGTITAGGKKLSYDVFIPAYSTGPNTKFLQGCDNVLDSNRNVDVNEFLQSKAVPELFGVGVTNAPEPFIGIAKLDAQWKSVADNVVAFLDGKALKKHKEGAPFMKLPPLLLVGHGPKGYGSFDFSNLPAPLKCCCCCGYAGFPCCPPCWPCCACGGCGACPCGYCCCAPEGSGPAAFGGAMSFKTAGFHFKGVGAPAQQSMK